MHVLASIAVAGSLLLKIGATAQVPSNASRGPLASVQSTLKEQQFYFGEVTGVLDDETRSALRRFQVHRGLPVTGEMDSGTLQSLQTAASDAANGSVRALAQETVQEDQKFLQRLESVENLAAVATPARPSGEKSTEPVTQEITREEAIGFVREYLDAAEQAEPDREVSLYADQVNYFGSKVSRKFVEKDQRNYYRRWPAREFTLGGEPEISRATEDSATVRFRIRYALHGSEGSRNGETENILRLRRTPDGLRIAGIQERKVTR